MLYSVIFSIIAIALTLIILKFFQTFIHSNRPKWVDRRKKFSDLLKATRQILMGTEPKHKSPKQVKDLKGVAMNIEKGSRWEVVKQTNKLPDGVKYIEVTLVKETEEFGMYVIVDNFDDNFSHMTWVREEGTPWEAEIYSDSFISLDDFNELMITGVIKEIER
jgi:hypothetical protein